MSGDHVRGEGQGVAELARVTDLVLVSTCNPEVGGFVWALLGKVCKEAICKLSDGW